MTVITWDDLFNQPAPEEIERIFDMWPTMITVSVMPIGMSAFGHLFFQKLEGDVFVLDTFKLQVRHVAHNASEFIHQMNDVRWQEKNLHSNLVLELKEKGIVRPSHQVFGFIPHPHYTSGRIQLDQTQLLDPWAWHSLCSQVHERNVKRSDLQK